MKVSIPKRATNKNPPGFVPPPIPLDRPEPKDLEKDDYVTLKLKTVPRSTTSAEYSLNVPYFRSGTPEEWLKFLSNLTRALNGQNLTTASHMYSMARRLLVGESLAHFEKKAESFVTVDDKDPANPVEARNETAKNFKECLQAVTMTVFPKKALMTQKRYMRRILRKPKNMKIRDYCARYSEINKYLEAFPPFKGRDQMISDEEVLEHLEFAVPNSWQKQMVLQGFNTLERSVDDFIEFCERLEFSEQVYDSSHNSGQKARVKIDENNSGLKPSADKNHSKKRKKAFYCLYHGENQTHDTNDCKLLKAQAEKMASAHAKIGKGKYAKRSHNNDSKEKMESFKAEIVRAVMKEFKSTHSNSSSKKRRVTEMDHFNMENFKNLSVSSDTDTKSEESDSEDSTSS